MKATPSMIGLAAALGMLWGFDFQGFGHSDRYPEMNESPHAHPPLCRAEDSPAAIRASSTGWFCWHRSRAARHGDTSNHRRDHRGAS